MTAGDLGFSPCGKQTGFAEARLLIHRINAARLKSCPEYNRTAAAGCPTLWGFQRVGDQRPEIRTELRFPPFPKPGKDKHPHLCWGDLIRILFAVRIRARL
jgi:hypothetical protein